MPISNSPPTVNKCVEIHFTGLPRDDFEKLMAWVLRFLQDAAEKSGPEGSAAATEINLSACDHSYVNEKEPAL